MKTYHIKDLLKKDILIIQIPDGFQCSECDENYYISSIEDDTPLKSFSKIDYNLLGKPDEISEEDAKAIVEYFPEILGYQNFKDDDEYYKETATEALLSAIESVIFWENPYREKIFVNMDISASMVRAANREIYSEKYHEAEHRTFDRSRTIIFVKQ